MRAVTDLTSLSIAELRALIADAQSIVREKVAHENANKSERYWTQIQDRKAKLKAVDQERYNIIERNKLSGKDIIKLKEDLAVSIDNDIFQDKVRWSLKHYGVYDLQSLLKLSEVDIMRMRGIGRISLKHIIAVLAILGLELHQA